ncbi:phenylacetic acid degradation protein PaaN [Streptosporangium vulgare]|uniref:Phenylacetic acid degradation protein PaaN n=1 Tax=Streptosporangium vulgare TaxID=46190 RepID=A0ABV5TMG4_9ACTN
MSTDRSARLVRAVEARRTRESWSAYPEAPSRHPGGEAAREAGLKAHESRLGGRFDLPEHPGSPAVARGEVSPYTGEPLGVAYPVASADEVYRTALAAWPAWRDATPETRTELCLAACDRIYERSFEFVPATMHTAGQSAAMSFTGSGTNALDRGIEAIAAAWSAMERVTPHATWTRGFGTAELSLDKRYRIVPRGVAVVVTCASFPAWNAYPAIFANLATGNPVIVKPHPTAVLPMALAVAACREVLAGAGFDPGLVTLAVDTAEAPVAKELIGHPACRIVDFTGSAAFGAWVEANAFPAISYTETSGLNAVVLDSADDLAPVLRAVAGSLCLFSAQMCTSPQNIFVPRAGVRTSSGTVSFEEVGEALAEAVRQISTVPRRAASVLAAIQSPATLALVDGLRDRGTVLLDAAPYEHPEFPAARTSGPLLLATEDPAVYGEERFGPVAFLVPAEDREAALRTASADARDKGAITAFCYSVDEDFVGRAEDAFALAGAALTSNLTGPMPLNFSAAYSDYHVSGLNPAGNASLTDDAFVSGRFRVTQSRRPAVSHRR